MQSNLKKSLYLGLAALSFASVASVTANSSNANAAKKHAAAKKVTYKTTDSKLDQSVVFKSTGKNAVYNKAVGKRSVVASLSDMKAKANSKSTNDLFMAYQSGVTSKGVHYYKVVSFDKKVRGFVYNKGVAKVDNSQNVATPNNTTGYLTQTNRFFNQAYGVQFHNNNLKHNYDGMNIAADQFTVSKAVKVNNDQTYYYVTDKNNQLINGWVNSVYFSNTVTPAAQKALDSANAVHINFVDADNLGSIVSTANVQPNNGSYNNDAGTNNGKNYSNDQIYHAASNALIGSGYHFYTANYSNVKKGDTITIQVKKNSDSDKANVKFNFVPLTTDKGLPVQDTTPNVNLMNDANSLNETQRNQLSGHNNDSVNLNDVFNNFFANTGSVWNTIKSAGQTYVFDKDATLAANKNLLNNKSLRMSDANNVTVYYMKVQPNSSQVSANDTQAKDQAATQGFFDNPTKTTDSSKSSDQGGQKADSSKSSDQGGQKADSSKSGDQGGQKADSSKSGDQGGQKGDSSKSNDQGGQKADSSKSGDQGGQKADSSKSNDQGGQKADSSK